MASLFFFAVSSECCVQVLENCLEGFPVGRIKRIRNLVYGLGHRDEV